LTSRLTASKACSCVIYTHTQEGRREEFRARRRGWGRSEWREEDKAVDGEAPLFAQFEVFKAFCFSVFYFFERILMFSYATIW
jgi:hypothetical protein